MYDTVVWSAFNSKNKTNFIYPHPDGNITDIIEFGFSYIEHEDHLLEYIISGSTLLKKIISEIKDFHFLMEGPPIGTLWTSKIYLTSKLSDNQLIFSNVDFSHVLYLNTNIQE